jgi:hypothetical protein
MLKRLSLLAAAGALAAACATSPTTASSTSGPASLGPAASGGAGVANALNIASTSQWVAEERLMPQDPILALINAGGSVDNPAGFAMTCNPANGTITARLGKQPTARVGQSATYRIRMGAEAKSVEGKFETNPKSPEADFVFPLASVDVRTMSQLDIVSVLTDQGEVQWAFVRDPAAQVQAKYIGSLKDMAQQSRDYLEFCNPK